MKTSFILVLLLLILSPVLKSQVAPVTVTGNGNDAMPDDAVSPAIIITGEFLGETPPLKDLPVLTNEEWQAMKDKEINKVRNPDLKKRIYPYAEQALPRTGDQARQKEMGTNRDSRAPILNFSGPNAAGWPSDANGTIGPNHYMQTINLVYTIYNRAGVVVAGPTNLNTLFYGLAGSNCNDGDPVVLYDEQADRWLVVEFSLCNNNDYMLMAVSTTNDPTGTWYKYSFDVGDVPDYEKMGVWQDGYYMGTNTNGNADIYVFQRSQMLAGLTPLSIGFDNPWRPGPANYFNCVPPLDNDGTFAPTGEPGLFISFNDDAIGGGSDQLWIYELDVDWADPDNATFNRTQQINVTAFDSNFGLTMSNISQPGTAVKLDAIPQVIMNPPQYRNFGAYETIVCCHTVDVDATDHAGIRWYELRRVGSGDWTIRQQSTYAPDGNSRFMGSMILNGSGEIALGYSISSSTTYPGIRYCGQSAAAYAAGNSTLDVAEEIIQAGTYSQTNYNRWGDYAALQVDMADDETFWFTSQYSGSSNSVKTKIANFQIGSIILTANFAVDNPNPQLYSAVTFTDVSFGSPAGWNWTITPSTFHFLNGTSATSQNPAVQFTEPGYYTVSLAITNGGNNDTETKTGFINAVDCGSLYLPFNCDFAGNTLPACWKNIDNIGQGHTWVFDNPMNRPVNTATAGNGFALLDSYMYGIGNSQNADLITPLLDLSAYTTVNLYFQHWFYYQTPSTGRLFYSINGGATWTQITSWSSSTTNPAIYDQDVTSFVAGQSRVRFKWNYTATYGIIWAIDDISITGTGPNLWTGATSSDWATASNWSEGTVPTSTSNVYLPSSAPNWPSYTGNFTLGTNCDKLTLFGPAQLNVTGNFLLPAGKTLAFNGYGAVNLAGDWIYSGGTMVHGNGTIKFSGSSSSAITQPNTTNITGYQRSTFTKSMTNLSGATTGPSGTNSSQNVGIGFTFNYLGTNYTQVRICTNGWITLDLSGGTSNSNEDIFNTSAPHTTLAPWFDYLNVDGSGSVSYKMEGAIPYRIFTVEWKNVLTYWKQAAARINFQVKLYETTNIIEFHYGSLVNGSHNNSEGASIGIEDATGGSNHFIEATTGSFTTGISNLKSETQWPAVNYRFSPPLPGIQEFQNITVDKSGSYLNIIPNTVIIGNLSVMNGTLFGPGLSYGALNIYGDWTNNGTYTPFTGKVIFKGPSSQNIGGSSQTQFSKLIVNNPAGISLTNSQTVSDSLTMTSGNIDCGSYTLTLGTSATNTGKFIYTSGNILGSFKRWVAASTATPLDFPVGTSTSNHNLKITFTNNTAGSLTARFEPGDPGSNTGFPLTENSVTISANDIYTEGSWTLVPNTLTSTSYALELTGTGFSSNGTPDETVRILKRPDAGGDWILNGTHVNGSPPVAKRAGLSGFSRFILAKPGSGNSISGNIKYYNLSNTPILSGVTVKLFLGGSQVGSDFVVTNGTYQFSNLNPGTYELRISSSNSTVGSLNSSDAAQTNYWGVNPYSIEKVRFYAGDVTGGTYFINGTDAQRIQQNFVYGTAFDKGTWAFWKTGETISSNTNPPESYPQVSFSSGNITANIYALCAGDFNRSFVPGLKNTAGKNLDLIYTGTRKAGINEEIDLPLITTDACITGAISLVLDYPAEMVEILDVEMENHTGQLDWASNENELRIGWNSLNPVQYLPGDRLIILKIKTTEAFLPGNEIRFSLAENPLNEITDGDFNVIPGAVLGVDVIEASTTGTPEPGPSPYALSLSSYPNPFMNFTKITYTLPVDGEVTLEICNMLGARVALLIDETQTAGNHSVAFNPPGMESGIFTATLRLKSAHDKMVRTIKVVHNK